MPNDNLYAPPNAELEVSEPHGLATRGSRLVGAILDSIFAALLIFPTLMATGYWERMMTNQSGVTDTLIIGGIGTVSYLILHGYLLATRGQTIGKFLAKTRIVSVEDDKILPLGKLLLTRALPVLILPFIPIVGQFLGLLDPLFVFREDRRCVHDLIAGTKVVTA
jgi:uncharacterized RDD family membrane protein YckC